MASQIGAMGSNGAGQWSCLLGLSEDLLGGAWLPLVPNQGGRAKTRDTMGEEAGVACFPGKRFFSRL